VDLAPGDYQARIDHPEYLISISHFHVDAAKESAHQITVIAKPKKSLVKMQKTQLKLLDMVYFNTGTAELEARSEPLLTEVADALLRTPEVLRVEVQGHTDNVGEAAYNLDLSQRRAETVRDFLIRNGVEASRLEAKGYGLTKPVAPNKGEKGRAKNRRVAFIILERAAP
jgi:outer membrane protein OmpA-like peptidoglycan-associated protein